MLSSFLDRICKDPVYFAYRIIGYGLAIFLVVMVLGCATPPTVKNDGLQPDGSMSYTLTPEQVAQCEREGGCSTVTLQYERELVREAAKHFCGVDI